VLDALKRLKRTNCKLDINPAQTKKQLAEQLSITQQAIFVRLRTIEKVRNEGRWIPHELSEDNKNRRRDTALTLFLKFRKKDFLHKIITGIEKWILYDKRKKSWIDPHQPSTSTPKHNIHVKKILLCI